MSRPPWVDETVNDVLRKEIASEGGGSATVCGTAASVEAYLEYRRIVGEADGGTLFTPEQYAAYREAAAARAASRLYVHWRSTDGLDCKTVGPESQCECGHRYKQHASERSGVSGGLRCRAARCGCVAYAYLPAAGTWAAKCGCKHAAGEHDGLTKRCSRCACAQFAATFSCACGLPWSSHATSVETREERSAAGRPVDNLCGGGAAFASLGGLTSFSSLVDGVDREAVGSQGVGASGSTLARLKASARRLAESRATVETSSPRAPSSPPPPLPLTAPHNENLQSFAEKRRLAAVHAAALADQRRAAARRAEDEEIATLPELEQLYRLSLRK